MKLKNAKISILVGSKETTITIIDYNSSTSFVEVTLTPEQLSMALSRLVMTPCEVNVRGLDKVGKRMEHKQFEFELTGIKGYCGDEPNAKAVRLAKTLCPEGWIPDLYFGSQSSYFTKDGKSYARCTIRRWVDDTETNSN